MNSIIVNAIDRKEDDPIKFRDIPDCQNIVELVKSLSGISTLKGSEKELAGTAQLCARIAFLVSTILSWRGSSLVTLSFFREPSFAKRNMAKTSGQPPRPS